MSKPPEYFVQPPIEKTWSGAKKKAEAAAKKEGASKAWSALEKQFNLDLSPLLKKFIGAWPDLPKIQKLAQQVTQVCKAYTASTKKADGLGDPTKKHLLDALKDLVETIETRVMMAESALESPATKAEPAKPMTSWTLIDLPDLMPRVVAKSKDKSALAALGLGKIPIELCIDNKAVLTRIADHGNDPLFLQKIKDAVDLDLIGLKVAERADEAAKTVAKDPSKAKAEGAALQQCVEDECRAATVRAFKTIDALADLAKEVSKFRFKLGAALTVKVLAVASSVVGTFFAGPITLGLGLLGGMAGLAVNVAGSVKALKDIRAEAQQVMGALEKSLENLAKVYAEAKLAGKNVGVQEWGRYFAPGADSVKAVMGDIELAQGKLKAIELEAHKLSTHLADILDGAEQIEKALKGASRKLGKDIEKLSPGERKAWTGLLDNVQKMRGLVMSGIDGVIEQEEKSQKGLSRLAPIQTRATELRDAYVSKSVERIQAITDVLLSLGGGVADAYASLAEGGNNILAAVLGLPDLVADLKEGHETMGEIGSRG